MRVAVAGHGATGHIYPLLGFADAPLAAGHDVIIQTGSDLIPWLTDLGYAAEAVGETIGWGFAQVHSRFPELTTSLPAEQAWRFDAELFADALPRAMAPALVTAFESRRLPTRQIAWGDPRSGVAPSRHHGASRGTLLAAAAEGVPQLVMPMGADQFQMPTPWPAAGRDSPYRKVASQRRRSEIASGS